MRLISLLAVLSVVTVYGHPEECLNGVAAPAAGFSCTPLAAVDLGVAANYAILAGSAISRTNGGGVTSDSKVGLFPGTAVIGFDHFDLQAAFDGKGSLYTAYEEAAAAYVGPADRTLVKYVVGQELAYNPLTMYKPADYILSDRDLGGMTLKPGVYKFAVAGALNGRLVLDDSTPASVNAPHVWIFQTGSTLIFTANSEVVFKTQFTAAGVNAAVDNVIWQVGSSATLMGGVKAVGNFLAYASVTSNADVQLNGRVLAKNAAVTLIRTTLCSNALDVACALPVVE